MKKYIMKILFVLIVIVALFGVLNWYAEKAHFNQQYWYHTDPMAHVNFKVRNTLDAPIYIQLIKIHSDYVWHNPYEEEVVSKMIKAKEQTDISGFLGNNEYDTTNLSPEELDQFRFLLVAYRADSTNSQPLSILNDSHLIYTNNLTYMDSTSVIPIELKHP